MKQSNQPKSDISNNSGHNGATSAYWKSVRACVARPDGITEIVHANGFVERFDVSSRPIGLRRLRTSERAGGADAPKRSDLKTLACDKIIPGPSVIRADGLWKIIHRDGVTERFAETRKDSAEAQNVPCAPVLRDIHSFAA